MNHQETSGEHIVTFYCLALAMLLGLETSGDFPIYVIRMVAAPFLSLTSSCTVLYLVRSSLISLYFRLFTIGLPLFFFELGLGQYAGIGPAKLFGKLYPASVGVGWGMVIVAFLVVIYYNMIIAWTLYYLYSGFSSLLPWSVCDTSSSKACFSISQNENCLSSTNKTAVFYNSTCTNLVEICSQVGASLFNSTHCKFKGSYMNINNVIKRRDSSEDFFSYKMLGLQEENSWDNLGTTQPHLVICLILAWSIVAACLCKGVKSSGKVVYFTAIYPFIILIVFFIRGITLPGAMEGIHWYITSVWSKLLTIQPWADAASQIFYSLGVCFGTLLTFASYNQ